MFSDLELIEDKLNELLRKRGGEKEYIVPSLWLNPGSYPEKPTEQVSAFEYFINRIKRIRELNKTKPKLPVNDKTKNAVIYNMFVRHTTAFDHNGDGKINIDSNINGFRETGTFLKAISMLPYIQSLGVNTLYLLPITLIGIDGRKGSLGSPYAIRNPYKIDERLAEPALDLNEEVEFNAFVEAAHLLGMKVVVEFVFRTASIDSELALEHPDWFYWLKADVENRKPGSKDESKYGPPIFSKDEISEIRAKVESYNFMKLPPPHEIYRELFTDIPKTVTLKDNKIIGTYKKDKECKIPGAFADWPPDDVQPPWSDVTYLRLYDHPDFNYIAYNTVRMYEKKLAKISYMVADLWENICNIIPYYQNNFGIDGVMIDMGHSLPRELRAEIIKRAREIDKDFIFWEENFVMTQNSADDGYDAVVGYLPFDAHNPGKIKEFVYNLSAGGFPIPYFATPETHNTHRAATRAGNTEFSKFVWALFNFLPGIPFILSGFEIGETKPVNTGLGFSPEEIKILPASKLPLFSEGALCWDNPQVWISWLRRINKLKDKYIDSDKNYLPETLVYLENTNENIITFTRKFPDKPHFLFMGNMHPEKEIYFNVKLPKGTKQFTDLLSGAFYNIVNDELIMNLKPFRIMCGELI